MPIFLWAQQQAAEEIDRRVEDMLGKLTLDEKIEMIHGVDDMFLTRRCRSSGCSALKTSDGPMGIRRWGPTTAYAGGIGLAASWDTELAERVG